MRRSTTRLMAVILRHVVSRPFRADDGPEGPSYFTGVDQVLQTAILIAIDRSPEESSILGPEEGAISRFLRKRDRFSGTAAENLPLNFLRKDFQ